MRVTSCRASHTSCKIHMVRNLQEKFVSLRQNTFAHLFHLHLQKSFWRFWRNCVRTKHILPVLQVTFLPTEPGCLWGVQLPSNLMNTAKVLNLLNSLQPTALHELPELLECDSISEVEQPLSERRLSLFFSSVPATGSHAGPPAPGFGPLCQRALPTSYPNRHIFKEVSTPEIIVW